MKYVAVAALLLATPASAQPAAPKPSADSPLDPLAPPREPAAAAKAEDQPLFPDCLVVYGEGHLLVGGRTGPAVVPEPVITRWSFGASLCQQNVDLQAGLVLDADIATDNGHSRYSGKGAEARILVHAGDFRIGPHLAIVHQTTASSDDTAFWIGARLARGPVIVGADVLRIPGGQREAPYDVWGFYGSIGLRGWPGLIGLAAVTLVWGGNIILNEHGS